MERFDNIIEYLEKWETGGKKILINGTKLICHTPYIGPNAWLHEIYGPLTIEEIERLQMNFSKVFPFDYIEFLKLANGINIFSDSISIWGLRKSYVRSGDEAFQPYDLITENKDVCGQFSNDLMMFGSYSWDGSIMAYDFTENSSKVFLLNSDSHKRVKEWDNIWIWLTQEIQRMSLLFDKNGAEYDEDEPTIP